MKMTEKNFTSQILKPRTSTYKSSEMDLMIFLTPWGEGNSIELINDEITKFLFAAQGDMEVTSPFEFNTSLSKVCNSLRMATLITNDMIYRTENKNDIKTVYEMLILYKDKNLLSWLQIGSPHVLLMKDNLYPVSCKTLGTRAKSNEHVPLPSQFFGAEPHCHFQVGSLPIEKNEKVLLLNCELISPNLWSQYSKNDSLETIFKNQIKFNSNESFWGSLIEFES